MANGNGLAQNAGVWKWICAILVAILLAGLPGYIELAMGVPSPNEVAFIRDRQDNVLQRLATIEETLKNNDEQTAAMREEMARLRELIEGRR